MDTTQLALLALLLGAIIGGSVSAVIVAAAPGVFGGRDVLIMTTDFGAR